MSAAPLDYDRNHEPHQIDVWFEYTGFRYKDRYAIELKSGEVIDYAMPNGDAWFGKLHGCVFDDEVAKIRLLRDDELHKYDFKAQSRIERNLRMFGAKDELAS